MNNLRKPILTSAERRGFIVLLVAVATIIIGVAISKHFNSPTATIIAQDSTAISQTIHTENIDSIPPKNKKKKTRTKSIAPNNKNCERDPFRVVPRQK